MATAKSGGSRLFGGVNLKDVASQVKERGEGSPLERSPAQPTLAAAELALKGRSMPSLERENIHAVDPKRCRPWKFHNRTDAWYTRERCQDLIDSIAKDGQLEPALARKLEGEKDYDFELIFGMRRRFACEVTGQKLKVRVVEADDARAAVLMHIENADRQDITPMERAISFLTQVEGKVFPTQSAMAEALGVSKGQVAKMIKAAGLLKVPSIAGLFPDRSLVPVEQAYKLASIMERPGAKEIVLKAAQNLGQRGGAGRAPAAVLNHLAASLDRRTTLEIVRREYNVGAAGRVQVLRNPKGKVTLTFRTGLKAADREAVLAAMEKILADLG
jgi:ParB family transcriptional regulator, chromosome partitioning protein